MRELIVSIHALRVGCDSSSTISMMTSYAFQFTHPVRGATLTIQLVLTNGQVSIHAPRVGCDVTSLVVVFLASGFNSRTPCGVRLVPRSSLTLAMVFQFTHPVWGATPKSDSSLYVRVQFQFTHPVWGATSGHSAATATICGFNSRTPCGVRLTSFEVGAMAIAVSIHAPRVGCDQGHS